MFKCDPVAAHVWKQNRKAAKRENAQAQFRKGLTYYSNHERGGQTDREAVKWFKLAAAQGHPGREAGTAAARPAACGVPEVGLRF